MLFVKPKGYSKKKIDYVGRILVSDNPSKEELEGAIEVFSNWRASHSYPLHVFKARLKNKSEIVDDNALTAQRLKRVTAIIKKLKRSYNGRPPTMKLSQMQDIAGCRAVLSNVSLARKLYKEHYVKGDLKHEKVGEKDYITYPKEDGYRSIHLIYRYHSNKGKKCYNGFLVEIQIRSKLQHIWATAVETVDFFTRQAIKSNEGDPNWMEFFKLVSSAFAKMENCPCVPNTPEDEKELISQIKKKAAELKVIKRMKGWARAVEVLGEELHSQSKKKLQYFLLELDIPESRLLIKGYTKEEEIKAIEAYTRSEKRDSGNKEYDVVLVGVDTITDLKRAYPNYFVDMGDFLHHLEEIMAKN